MKACELSMELNYHLFATRYHAVALLAQDTILVTADQKYFNKAKSHGSIALLENFELHASRRENIWPKSLTWII